jgi:hypothetical protein
MNFTDKPCASGYRSTNGEWVSVEQEAKRKKEKLEKDRIEQERIVREMQEKVRNLAEKARQESTLNSQHPPAAPINQSTPLANSQSASPDDVRETNNFLSRLPPACSNSYANTLPDGTVSIRIICNDQSKAVDGLVEIKNGIVIRIR